MFDCGLDWCDILHFIHLAISHQILCPSRQCHPTKDEKLILCLDGYHQERMRDSIKNKEKLERKKQHCKVQSYRNIKTHSLSNGKQYIETKDNR